MATSTQVCFDPTTVSQVPSAKRGGMEGRRQRILLERRGREGRGWKGRKTDGSGRHPMGSCVQWHGGEALWTGVCRSTLPMGLFILGPVSTGGEPTRLACGNPWCLLPLRAGTGICPLPPFLQSLEACSEFLGRKYSQAGAKSWGRRYTSAWGVFPECTSERPQARGQSSESITVQKLATSSVFLSPRSVNHRLIITCNFASQVQNWGQGELAMSTLAGRGHCGCDSLSESLQTVPLGSSLKGLDFEETTYQELSRYKLFLKRSCFDVHHRNRIKLRLFQVATLSQCSYYHCFSIVPRKEKHAVPGGQLLSP